MNWMSNNLKIMTTTSYDRFKKLDGNRKVDDAKTSKIVKSIQKVGYIPNPIIVNEKMEIIDGQGRFSALKKLGLPVCYIVVSGIGITECIEMNINQSNWKLMDYIESYAELGNVSYKYLHYLLNEYSDSFAQKVIICATTRKFGSTTRAIKNGDLSCDASEYDNAIKTLDWLKQFIPIIKRIDGRTEFYYLALCFCYNAPEIDIKRLYKKMRDGQGELYSVGAVNQALRVIDELYNYRLGTPSKVDIPALYRLFNEGKYSWYGSRHGNKNKYGGRA